MNDAPKNEGADTGRQHDSVTPRVANALPETPPKNEQPKETKKHTLLEKVTVAIAALAFAAAMGQAYVANDTEITQFRAIIVPEIVVRELGDGAIVVTPIFKNSGLTPTKQMWANIRTYSDFIKTDATGNWIYPSGPDPTIDWHNRFWIGPQQQIQVNGLSGVFEKSKVDRAKGGQGSLILMGIIQYRDVFKLTPIHTQRFCYSVWFNTYLFGDNKWDSGQCGGNKNCTDDECPE